MVIYSDFMVTQWDLMGFTLWLCQNNYGKRTIYR